MKHQNLIRRLPLQPPLINHRNPSSPDGCFKHLLFSFTSIYDYQEALKEGTLSCRDAVLYYLERIKRLSHLNAFIQVYHKESLEMADRLDTERMAGNKPGCLHGVIIGIKD